MLAECELWNDCLYYHDNMIVSNSEFLWFKILEFIHDTAVVNYLSWAKTYEIVQWFYYWSEMHDFVQKYVQFCQTCVWEKFWHVKKQDVLRLFCSHETMTWYLDQLHCQTIK